MRDDGELHPETPCCDGLDATETAKLLETPKGSYGDLTYRDVKKTKPKKPRALGIFSYAETWDYFLIAAGTAASVVHGAGFPLLSVVLGGMTTVFLRAQNSEFVTGHKPNVTGIDTITQEEFNDSVTTYAFYYLGLGVAMFVTSYIQIACWEAVAERVVHALRQNYLKTILRQEIAWFDTMQTGNLTARLSDDLERVREGLGDKASLFIQMIATFFAGFIVGFIYNWQMALIMSLFTPLLAAMNAWIGKITANRTHVEQQTYAIAGGIAEEVFSSIRTVLSLNGQHQELRRYEKALEEGRKVGLLKYMYMGIGVGGTFFIMYASYAVSFWFGSRLILWDPDFDRGTIFTVFFAVMTGSTALGTALPNLGSIASAKGAARHVLSVINNKPKIDPYSDEGLVIPKIRGAISIENAHFSYPIRKDIKILNGVSFSVAQGKKIALVGPSGCGKSTIVNLIMRFYDPEQGRITLDGHDLRQLNVRSLRDAIGVVSQEPILFDGTLEENIMLGNESATREDVIRCCKMANAYDFIQKLPDGLYTRVGERGVQMSGGQKQRIAIARALIRNPKILLLDEATSALDTESEQIVQTALEKAQEGRTTIIVAHRLSTIKNVDRILVFRNGEIVESGTHEELVTRKGIFYDMVEAQQIEQKKDEKALEQIREELENSSGNGDGYQSTAGGQTTLTRGSPKKISSPRRKYTTDSMHSGATPSTYYEIREMQEEIEESTVKPTPMSKIFRMGKETWHFLLAGLVASIVSGMVTPFFAIVYSQIFAVFSEPPERLNTDAIFWSAMFLVIGVLSSGAFFISANMLGRCGEGLTKKLRYEAFRNLLRQDVGFYDDQRHNTGILCTRFATDAPNVRYVFTRLPAVISSVVTLVGAIAIGFVFGWKLALILLIIVPLIVASGYFEMKMRYGKQLRDTRLLEDAGKIASEAVENIRTVQGLNKQLIFHQKYCHNLEAPYKANMRQAHVYGGVFAFSQSLMFFMYAIAFWLGAKFVNDHSMQPADVYRVFFAIAFCGQSVGQISSFIPDVVKARLAASLLFHLIEYPTMIDSLSDLGVRRKISGNIRFDNIHFCYPTRLNTRVLSGLNVEVKEGETLALVGYSGSGKSTVMALLERFYSPIKGHILVDGTDVTDLNIHSLREQVAMVSQEPILFDCTIAENISYGMDRPVSHEEVVKVAQQANIHNFVLGLPMGYETRVGEKGTQLSGGQKQRIAIARALIRDPSVLLLDEATSALDTESEKIVQEALENARKGRTCLVIAHRLSTVQNAHQIAVINEGKLAEKGTHQELLQKGGIYTSLCSSQVLQDTAES